MVVQHNLQAMNSNRMLNVTQGSLSKSTEKLSSGYRINRAADDAAGLAISEKMRKQINGLNQASSNAQDGISCVQTAEGALAEVEDMLQRMNQLSVQAANGTNSVDDRQNIQDEIDQLVTEIDRVAETSKFNETYLLKGSTDGGKQAISQFTYNEYKATTWGVDANAPSKTSGSSQLFIVKESDNSTVTIDASNANLKGHENDFFNVAEDGTVTLKDGYKIGYDSGKKDGANTIYTAVEYDAGKALSVTFTDVNGTEVGQGNMPKTGVELSFGADKKYFVQEEDGSRKYLTDANIEDYMEVKTDGSVQFKEGVEIKTIAEANGTGQDTYKKGDVITVKATDANKVGSAKTGNPMLYDKDGNRISENALADIMLSDKPTSQLYIKTGQSLEDIGVNNETLQKYVKTDQEFYADDLELTFHVGSEGAASNKISIDIESMDSVNLGVDILSSKKNGIVDEDGQSATDAIGVISEAIKKVSSQRSALGAIQNRLEHTINNLDNIAENTTSAESAIRDTDMATEMVKYSNANILAQAGQSMLAQANQSNQGVLSLLG